MTQFNKIKMNKKLKNTWQTYQMLELQYFDTENDASERYLNLYNQFQKLHKVEKQILVLYSEYQNTRGVAEEFMMIRNDGTKSQLSKTTICNILNNIKDKFKNL